MQDIERAAGAYFRNIGMPEIADDDPLPLSELSRHQRTGTAWVAVDITNTPAAYRCPGMTHKIGNLLQGQAEKRDTYDK